MVEGQLKCLGTPQHLKTRFGRGYQLDARLTLKDGRLFSKLCSTFGDKNVEHHGFNMTFTLLVDTKETN